MKLSNIYQPTSAKWTKIGIACKTASIYIMSQGHFSDNNWIFYVGTALGVLATIIPPMMGDDSASPEATSS